MIEILPQNVANQIAAGEVVQRPASIVKELMENSVDAGGMSIVVRIEDAGKSLIQVIDNGVGMSREDAVRSFVRHATSKIRTADDLFNLHTFGFRGEALASIASVAEVDMRTRRMADEVGTQVLINGGSEAQTTAVSTPVGTNISVRNLFFNTPARRKFLKANASENRQILLEFQRVALVNPDIAFTLVMDNAKTPLTLAAGNLHQRIVALTNKTLGTKLLTLESKTPFVSLSGYVGTPTSARKSSGDQYFFVNGRYMRSPYLQKAVVEGFGKLLPLDVYPTFFIYIEVEPQKLDVNIHPTKTEVKFEDEQLIWQVLNAAVRQTLGKHNIIPTLDFENDTPLEIPAYDSKDTNYKIPSTNLKSDYNPFLSSANDSAWDKPDGDPELAPFREIIPDYLRSVKDTQELTEQSNVTRSQELRGMQELTDKLDVESATIFNSIQYQRRYVITTSADGVLIIDYPRAMQRIAYEKILQSDHFMMPSQGQLHPEAVELSRADHSLVMECVDEVAELGFNVGAMGGTTVAIFGMPVELVGKVSPEEALESLITGLKEQTPLSRRESVARGVTQNIARVTPRVLSPTEISALLTDLFATDEPSLTPNQLPIIEIINPNQLFKR